MARQPLRVTRGTAAQIAAYTGGAGEPVFNIDAKTLHLQDGTAPGGIPLITAPMLSFARTAIASMVVPVVMMTFAVAGYNTAGDLGRGAPYKAGTSAGPGAIQDKLGRWFEVDVSGPEICPEWFGGFADGVTDCTAAINLAETLASVRGATVRFSCGTYMVRGVTKRSKSRWAGAGVGRTIIKLIAGTTATAVVAGLNAYALRGGSDVATGCFEFDISGVTIDGNRGGGGKSDGLGLYGAVFRISDYEIRNCSGVGQWTEFPFGGIPTLQKNVQSQFYNGYVHECRVGIEYGGPNDAGFYDVYPYLNDEINLRTYGAGSGKFTQNHPWCDAVGGPQVTTGVLLESPGNIFIGCAMEGARGQQIWCRANNQTFVACYTFYNQLSVAGRSVIGLRIGDNGTDTDTRGYAEVQGVRFLGKIQNCDITVLLSQDRGFHVLDIDGFTTRQNAAGISGQQSLVAGLPTSRINLAIQSVTDGVNPAPGPIPRFVQEPGHQNFYGGVSVLAGGVTIGVTTANATLDCAGTFWLRETNTAGAVITATFEGGGAGRLSLGRLRGQDVFGDLAINAYGADQFVAGATGVKLFVKPRAGDSAAVAMGAGLKDIYFKGDGTLSISAT